MQALGVERAGQLDGVRRAADVERRVPLGRRGHVVDGGEVEEVVDLAAQLGHLLLLDAQQRPAQVADDRLDAAGGARGRPLLQRSIRSSSRPERAVAHEHVDLALALFQQRLTRWRPMKPVAPVTK